MYPFRRAVARGPRVATARPPPAKYQDPVSVASHSLFGQPSMTKHRKSVTSTAHRPVKFCASADWKADAKCLLNSDVAGLSGLVRVQ